MTTANVLPHRAGRPAVTYLCNGLCTVSGHLLSLGIFFYMQLQFGWGARLNLLLAALEGLCYTVGALLAHRVAHRLGQRRTLIVIHALCMTALLGCALFADTSPWVIVPLILFETMCVAVNWPVLESLLSTGCDAHTVGRRLGLYNLVWSGGGVLTMALAGLLLEHAIDYYFYVPAAAHLLIMILAWRTRDLEPSGSAEVPHMEAEPALRRMRSLALWLSRLAMPAAFVVAYSLGAILPNLPSIQSFNPSVQTVIGSVWLASRWVAFLVFGATVFWHTRPRLLLIATVAMMAAFLATTLRPSTLPWLEGSLMLDLVTMILAQVVLGLSMGLIYSASLYFGMVLSQGSTEHSGYHEALVGAGQTIGPALGLMAHIAFGGSLTAAIVAIAAILGVTSAASTVIAMKRP